MKKSAFLLAFIFLAMTLFACAQRQTTPTSIPTSGATPTPTATSTPTETPATPTPTEVPATPTPTFGLGAYPGDSWRNDFGESVLFDTENNRIFLVTNDMSVMLVDTVTKQRKEVASFADLQKEGAMDNCIAGLKDDHTLEVNGIFFTTADSPDADNHGTAHVTQLYYADIYTGEITTEQSPEEIYRPCLKLNDDYVTATHYAMSDTGIKISSVFPEMIVLNDRLIVAEKSEDKYAITSYDINSIKNKMGCEADAYCFAPAESREVRQINKLSYDAFAVLKYKSYLVVIAGEETKQNDASVESPVENCRLCILDGDLNEISSVEIPDKLYNPALYSDDANKRIFISDADTVYVYDCKTGEIKQIAALEFEGYDGHILIQEIKDENSIVAWQIYSYGTPDPSPNTEGAVYLINIATGEVSETELKPDNKEIFHEPYYKLWRPSYVVWDKEQDKVSLNGVPEIEIEDYSSEYDLDAVYCDWKNSVFITSRSLDSTFKLYSCYTMDLMDKVELVSHCVIPGVLGYATLDENNNKLFIIGKTDAKDNNVDLEKSSLFVWDYMRGLALPIVK